MLSCLVLSTMCYTTLKVSRDWQFAATMGARTKLVKIGTPAEEVARQIREEFFNGDGPHVTIECSGAESSIRCDMVNDAHQEHDLGISLIRMIYFYIVVQLKCSYVHWLQLR